MRFGLSLADSGARMPELVRAVRIAEAAGFDSVWLGEAYGSDAVSPLGYLAASTTTIGLGSGILQMHARTPAMTAMTAMTLDQLSAGRFRLGLGVSGPQVVEGWHGVPYGRPLALTREYVDIVRAIVARESPVEYDGTRYTLPLRGEGSTGLGRALKSRLHPLRTRVPIYLAALGPKNLELTGEIADGWLPIFYPPAHEHVFDADLERGLARRQPGLAALDVVASPQIALGADVAQCRDRLRPMLALYVGGMGARGRNFYFDLVSRLGFEAAATRVQDAFLDGRKAEAASLVPDELVDAVALVGPAERIRDQLEMWAESRVTTIALRTTDPDVIRAVAELA